MKVGIDKLGFFVPNTFVDMRDLANARNVDPAKFQIGIGQDEMAVNPATQDIITFAANAAASILTEEDKKAIDMIIVGTESSLDESKASAVVVHDLLGIQPFARSIEMKEACYATTAGLALARDHVLLNPDTKVLVIASDIAKYGLNTGGEPTQGAGSVAMLITADPKILALNNDNVALTQDIYDFWRPFGQAYPSVDGKFSNETYIDAFAKIWKEYSHRTNLKFEDFAAIAFHTPYTKMGKKALLPMLESEKPANAEELMEQFERGIVYNRRVGNLYTGSLYLSLISLLENSDKLSAGQRIGLFSYGSGTVAEFFSGELVEGYENHLLKIEHQSMLDARTRLSIPEYENMFNQYLDLNHNISFNDETDYRVQKLLIITVSIKKDKKILTEFLSVNKKSCQDFFLFYLLNNDTAASSAITVTLAWF
ncbi:Hydroxymethylglutaryl-CoA synthase [Lactococcus lactis]|nr:Hydroxymethylglutaryl-CoA synthase [Lactococcus lactis]